MIKNLETMSPIHLFNDAGILIDKNFRKMISEYGLMKGVLYNNVGKYADALNGEAFIPTSKLKEMAMALRLQKQKGQIPLTQKDITRRPDEWVASKETSFDELLAGVKGSGDDIEKALLNLDSLPDHLNAHQFKSMIEGLNGVKKNLPNLKLSENSDEALLVNDFHAMALQAMNDPKSWKKMTGEQAALAKEWADSYTVANDFIFQNADTLQGRTAMLLKQTDPNIAIPGAVKRPGYLYADQMAKIFFDDQTVASPMALREMRKAFGDDAFNAASRAYFEDIMAKNTQFVNGKVRIQSVNSGIWNRTKSFITGTDPEAAMKTQTISYNIPVMDLDAIAKQFSIIDGGFTNNRRAGVIEMFKSQTTGTDAVRTKYANEMVNKISEVIELAKAVEVPTYGDVSTFVKRRGVLGGLGSIANIFTGGAILSSPISSAGIMLMARFGMNALSDPKFLDGMVKVLDPSLSDVARKSALVTLGRSVFDPERAVMEGYDINNINDIIELISMGEMEQSALYNTTGEDIEIAASAAKAGQGVDINIDEELERVKSQPSGFNLPDSGFTPTDLSVLEENLASNAMPDPDSDVRLNEAQRVALAGGNLDQAIALRGNNTGLGSFRGVA
jgi:DNA-binding ferritin-like protein (Dps family)